MNNNKNIITLMILVLLLIGGLIYYFKNDDDPEISENNNKKNPIVLSENASSADSSMYVDNTNENKTSDVISDGQTYLNKITDIRKDINDGFDDLNQKVKYKTLFDEEDTMTAANALLDQLDKAKEKIQNLKIDNKFSEANKMHIQSIDLLVETVDNFKKLYYATTQEEQQKYSDLYNYKIDESNKILENIAIPQ